MVVDVDERESDDPMGVSSDIDACSSTATLREARSKLETAAGRADKALAAHQAGKLREAFVWLDLLFGGAFPSR